MHTIILNNMNIITLTLINTVHETVLDVKIQITLSKHFYNKFHLHKTEMELPCYSSCIFTFLTHTFHHQKRLDLY